MFKSCCSSFGFRKNCEQWGPLFGYEMMWSCVGPGVGPIFSVSLSLLWSMATLHSFCVGRFDLLRKKWKEKKCDGWVKNLKNQKREGRRYRLYTYEYVYRDILVGSPMEFLIFLALCLCTTYWKAIWGHYIPELGRDLLVPRYRVGPCVGLFTV